MATDLRAPKTSLEQESRDLGFGSLVSRQEHLRLLNRDGSFNVGRPAAGFWHRLASYHELLTMSWWKFFFIVTAWYLILNGVFAWGYWLCGPGALQGAAEMTPYERAFFFSIETFATIGYGNIVPTGLAANLVMTAESLAGLLSFALATGILFARFSRPTAHIIYSKHAVIAPYRGITSFQFRVVNARDNQLIDLHARVVMSRFEQLDGLRQRKYYPLPLERDNVAFFPLSWTVVHPIDESSPLFGWTDAMLRQSETEFLILLAGTDETFAQSVHSRSSYAAQEIVWGARFAPVHDPADNVMTVDMKKFHSVHPAS